jgi:hypothetical protein
MLEGKKMSIDLESMSDVFSLAQSQLLKHKIALIPICVQYGDRSEIIDHIEYINSSANKLVVPIYFPPIDLVDWNSNFYSQTVFLKAAASRGGILASIGTTIQHLGLAAGDLFQIVAVNLEYSENNIVIEGKGVDYWQSTEKSLLLEKSNDQYPILKILTQLTPEDWTSVLDKMTNELVQISIQICNSKS